MPLAHSRQSYRIVGRRHTTRAAFTLIEVVTAVSCSCGILALAIQLIYTSIGISKESNSHRNQLLAISRLTRDLSQDISQAQQVEADPTRGTLTIFSQDRVPIVWTLESTDCFLRSQRGPSVSTERYHLRDSGFFQMDLVDKSILRLTVSSAVPVKDGDVKRLERILKFPLPPGPEKKSHPTN